MWRSAAYASFSLFDRSPRRWIEERQFLLVRHREVADVLDMPLGTVKSVLVRGLDELKALLTKRGRN